MIEMDVDYMFWREYGLNQKDGSLATVANVRYLGFLICTDFAYFC